jgi:hypothetical protein
MKCVESKRNYLSRLYSLPIDDCGAFPRHFQPEKMGASWKGEGLNALLAMDSDLNFLHVQRLLLLRYCPESIIVSVPTN